LPVNAAPNNHYEETMKKKLVFATLLSLPLLAINQSSTAQVAPGWDAWPCEVLLCLANPAGPMAASACVPPIRRLYRAMARPRFSFPTCQQVGYPDNSQMMRDIIETLTANPNATTADINAGMTQTPVLTNLSPSNASVRLIGNAPLDPCEGGRTQVVTTGGEFGEVIAGQCRGPQIGWLSSGGGFFADTGLLEPVFEGYEQTVYPNAGFTFDISISGSFWQRVRTGLNNGDGGVSFVGAAGPTRYGPVPVPPSVLPTYTLDTLPSNAIRVYQPPSTPPSTSDGA
jgi:hypothetical protein